MIALRRIYYENAVYHVLSRGNNKRNILAKKEDKKAFLEAALKYKKRFIFKIYGYCLMGNHFHMLLEVQARAKIVNSAIDYEWSSARFYFEGKDQRDGVLDRYGHF